MKIGESVMAYGGVKNNQWRKRNGGGWREEIFWRNIAA